MPASSPDASFTLEDLLGQENGVETSSVPSKSAEKNGHFAVNGTPADTYAVRLKEFLLDDDNSDAGQPDERIQDVDGDEDDEDFVYTGDDAPEPLDYNAKLANILGADSSSGMLETASDHDSREASDQSAELVDRYSFPKLQVHLLDAQPPHECASAPYKKIVEDASSPSPDIHSPSISALKIPGESFPAPVRPPFLHPSVSRLRSFIPHHKARVSSSSTFQTSFSQVLSPEPSHFSAISRASSVSAPLDPVLENTVPEASHPIASPSPAVTGVPELFEHREVFRWTTLKQISSQIYPSFSSKAAAILDTRMGRPTVIVTGGLVCVGTDTGRTYVFDFKQQFKFVCGPETAGERLCV